MFDILNMLHFCIYQVLYGWFLAQQKQTYSLQIL